MSSQCGVILCNHILHLIFILANQTYPFYSPETKSTSWMPRPSLFSSWPGYYCICQMMFQHLSWFKCSYISRCYIFVFFYIWTNLVLLFIVFIESYHLNVRRTFDCSVCGAMWKVTVMYIYIIYMHDKYVGKNGAKNKNSLSSITRISPLISSLDPMTLGKVSERIKNRAYFAHHNCHFKTWKKKLHQ